MIAISYRREDSTPVAGRIHDRLQAEFGKKSVFMDFDSIPYGVDFREQIKQTLERARVVVAIIGPAWLGGRGRGSRRIDDPADFVRLEIATALQRGIPVIPVLVDDTPMPSVNSLPEELKGLAFRNALTLDTGVDFHHHADRLISGIRDLVKVPADVVEASRQPGSVPDKAAETLVTPARKEEASAVAPTANRHKMIFIAAGILLVLLLLNVGWYLFSQRGKTQEKPALSLAIATPVPVIAQTPAATPAPTATAVPTSTPLPSATPVASVAAVVATPMPVVIPAPSPPPIPTTPSNWITDDEVRAFIFSHYRATERKDLDQLLAQYDDLVDYNTDGRRDKAFIRNGYVNYFNRWPIAQFNIGDIRVVRSPGRDSVDVYCQVRYFVRDTASSRTKQGVADEQWTIVKSFGNLKIVLEKETVHSQATPAARRRGR